MGFVILAFIIGFLIGIAVTMRAYEKGTDQTAG